jgi:hypothetical protein
MVRTAALARGAFGKRMKMENMRELSDCRKIGAMVGVPDSNVVK